MPQVETTNGDGNASKSTQAVTQNGVNGDKIPGSPRTLRRWEKRQLKLEKKRQLAAQKLAAAEQVNHDPQG
jgi:hypothetical protein